MADRILLYNPRQQPVELHLDGAVCVVPPLAHVEHVCSGQVHRLIATGALQVIDAAPPAAEDSANATGPNAAPVARRPRRTTRPQR